MFSRVKSPVGAVIYLRKKTSTLTSTSASRSTSTSFTSFLSQALSISFPTKSSTKITISTPSSNSIQTTVTFIENTLTFLKSPLLKIIIILLLILLILFILICFSKMKKIKIDWNWKPRKCKITQENIKDKNRDDLTYIKEKSPKKNNKYGRKKEICIELSNLTSISNTTLLDDDQDADFNYLFTIKKVTFKRYSKY